jgi:hypothetical protein
MQINTEELLQRASELRDALDHFLEVLTDAKVAAISIPGKRVDGIKWIAQQIGLSERQARRLATQRQLPGVYRSRKVGRWKVHKVEFMQWHENRKQKSPKTHFS